MKKRYLLLLLTGFALVGCQEATTQEPVIEYNYGSETQNVRDEFYSKFASPNIMTNWKGIEINSSLGVQVHVDARESQVTGNPQASEYIKIDAKLNTSSNEKIVLNVDTISDPSQITLKDTVALESKTNASMNVNIDSNIPADSSNAIPFSKIESSAETVSKYGKANLTIAGNPMDTDFAYSKASTTVNLTALDCTSQKQTYLQGTLIYNISDFVNLAIEEIKPTVGPSVEIDPSTAQMMEQIKALIPEMIGVSKVGNDYYFELKFEKVIAMINQAIESAGSDISSADSLTIMPRFVGTGSLTAKVGFDDAGVLTEISTKIKDAEIKVNINSYEIAKVKINEEFKLNRFDGAIASITQDDINQCGENLIVMSAEELASGMGGSGSVAPSPEVNPTL